jgi:uncharacterized protein YbjT (DUF2867 family)
MYVVAGVSGRVGAATAAGLLDRGKQVRVLVRDEAKGRRWAARGAEVAIGSLDNWEFLTGALRGCEGALLLVPSPDQLALADICRYQEAIVDALAAAITASRLKHVVFISSIGGQLPDGNGPARSHHYAEERIAATGAIPTFVRAAYFMENWLHAMRPVVQNGLLPSLLDDTRSIPMVSAIDVGETAVHALLDPPRSLRVIELSGPREYRPGEVAQAFGRALGRPVQLVTVPPGGATGVLASSGYRTEAAGLLAELYAGINSGRIGWQGGAAHALRGQIPLDDVIAAAARSDS